MARKQSDQLVVGVEAISFVENEFILVGTSPLIMNRFSEKARQQLLVPARRRSPAERKGLPHDPIDEFRSAVYRLSTGPTLCAFPASGLKKALVEAARYVKRVTRTDVERQVFVRGAMLPVYGRPYVFMTTVRRPKDKTADVRTRAIFPQWAMQAVIAYPEGAFTYPQIAALVLAAGQFVGIGDWRPETKGSYGQFYILTPDLETVWEHVSQQGREEQLAALERAEPYDEETAELLAWLMPEAERQGFAITQVGGGRNG